MSIVVQNTNGTFSQLNTLADVAAAQAAGLTTFLDSAGRPYSVVPFAGGYLFNGLPLNVILYGQWYPGQQDAMKAAWASGQLVPPTPAVMALPLVDPSASASSSSSILLALGAAYVLSRIL